MTEDQVRVYTLMARRMAGEATPAELEELQQLLKDHPESGFVVEVLNATHSLPANRDGETVDGKAWAEKSWSSLEASMKLPDPEKVTPSSPSRIKQLRPWLIAAAVVAGIVLTIPFLLRKSGRPVLVRESNSIVMEKGGRSSMTLPDGTKVWVNGGSKLTYGDDFVNGTREVFLEGEASFEVAPDAAHPFKVRTGNVDIRVLGTRFNVKAYPGDGEVQTVLLSGKVSALLRNGSGQSREIILEPGQKLSFDYLQTGALEDGITLSQVSPEDCEETAWIQNRLVFRDRPFRLLARDLERWYNVTIRFEDASLENELFSGAFDRQQIGEALKALQIATPFTYTQNGEVILIRRARK